VGGKARGDVWLQVTALWKFGMMLQLDYQLRAPGKLHFSESNNIREADLATNWYQATISESKINQADCRKPQLSA
jgi:hypothetical protein